MSTLSPEYTLEDAVYSFLRSKRKRLAEKSYPQYEMVMTRLLRALGPIDVSGLEPPRGTELIEDFMDTNWGEMPHAYNRNLSVIRGLMKHMIERGRLARDPSAPIEKAKPDRKPRLVFSDDEIKRIIAAARTPEERIGLRLLLIYGLRKGALTNLQMSGFDEARRVVSFKTKGGKFHTVPVVTEDVWTAVAELRQTLTASDYLMHAVHRNDKPMTEYQMHNWWYERLADAGLVEPGTTSGKKMHAARHTAGQRVLNATGNLKAAQELLGHASISTTGNVYALAVDTPILTTCGWKTLGSVQVGDFVYAEDGSPTRVTHTSEVFTDQSCYLVSTADSKSIVASGDHRWLVHGRSSARVLTTSEIHESQFTYRVRSSAVLNFPEAELPIDPYVFGYWLGDGGSGTASIAVGDRDKDHLVKMIRAAGYDTTLTAVPGGWSVRFTDGNTSHFNATPRSTIQQKLRDLDVYDTGNKHIPCQYLVSSVEQRLALLAGLLDSDGCISGTDNKLRITFISVYDRLAEDVHTLVRSLGIRATIRKYSPHRGGYGVRDAWNICWSPIQDYFRLPRKRSRFMTAVESGAWSPTLVAGRGRRRDLMVMKTQPCESVPTRCIAVEHPSHLYLAGRNFVPTHNTDWGVEEMRGTLQGVDL